jgi:hypothetical protein
MTMIQTRMPTQRSSPATTPPDAATTGPLPTVVALAARENFADVCRFLADLWDAEPGDRIVREDRPSTWMREMAREVLGGPVHQPRHRTRWTR